MAAGLVALVAVRLNDPWDARHPRATLVVYHLDQDTGRAWRASVLERTPWVERVLTADGGRIAPSDHWALGRPHIAAAARPLPAPAAQARLARQADGSVLLTVVPPAGARELGLRLRADTAVTLEQVASLPVKLALTPGRWTRVNWEAAPQGVTLRLRPAGPGTLDVRHLATIDGWPAGAAALPPRPASEMPFDVSDSTRVSGSRRFSW